MLPKYRRQSFLRIDFKTISCPIVPYDIQNVRIFTKTIQTESRTFLKTYLVQCST